MIPSPVCCPAFPWIPAGIGGEEPESKRRRPIADDPDDGEDQDDDEGEEDGQEDE